ncbi:MAG: NADH:ubiquinone reductase (Na(+)-transporting) subunit C [Alistipes sp.]|nr:NADH:ubiquinone reductase (Na(+)-transporting) subunit C [Alistipes sp.]
MAINKNSNAYIIMYTVVMVVIVATLLTFAATSLKDRQNANAENEKKSAIMEALGMAGGSMEQTVKDFDEMIVPALIVDGVFTPQVDAAGKADAKPVLDKMADLKGLAAAENELPIFKYEKEGVIRYVIPVSGKGLWDSIWGYVALTEDGNTIAGVVFGHKGETPGLGAEIATEPHQNLYKEHKLFDDNGRFVSVKLVKGGAHEGNLHEVDAITGGTKTSDGVTLMLKNGLAKYEGFLRSLSATAAEDTTLSDDAVSEPVLDETFSDGETADVKPINVEEE